jgi:hypothetical protein
MPKNLKLGVLSAQILKVKDDLNSATSVETKDKNGNTVNVSAAKVNAAVAALKKADEKLALLCQQGVFGVKVKP